MVETCPDDRRVRKARLTKAGLDERAELDRRSDSIALDILHSLKSYTANEANKLLRRTGQFGQPESFDRWVRDADHFAKVIAYIENNPVKARLCKRPEDWRFGSAWFRKRAVR